MSGRAVFFRLLSAAGIVRVLLTFDKMRTVSLLILLFRPVRNLYFQILCMFLMDGRDSDNEPVRVADPVPVTVETEAGETLCGVTARLTEHNVTVCLDEGEKLGIGARVSMTIENGRCSAQVRGRQI